MKWILITNDPVLAAEAQDAGVERLMVDLERLGKQERQAGRGTFISDHTPEDIARMRAVVSKAELIVRINPWHAGSPEEVEQAVEAGPDSIMLPMIEDVTHVEALIACLRGRARALPLVETAYSMRHIGVIAAQPAVQDLYIGLNDLHLSLGLGFLFEPLALGMVDSMAARIKDCGKRFGFGGIGAIDGGGELPAERILGEHMRLGSQSAILSSRFWKDTRLADADSRAVRLNAAIIGLNEACRRLAGRSLKQQQAESADTIAMIKALAKAADAAKS